MLEHSLHYFSRCFHCQQITSNIITNFRVPRQSWLIKLWIQNHNREEWPDLTICQPEDAPHVLKEECRPRREDIEKMCQKGFDSTYELRPP